MIDQSYVCGVKLMKQLILYTLILMPLITYAAASATLPIYKVTIKNTTASHIQPAPYPIVVQEAQPLTWYSSAPYVTEQTIPGGNTPGSIDFVYCYDALSCPTPSGTGATQQLAASQPTGYPFVLLTYKMPGTSPVCKFQYGYGGSSKPCFANAYLLTKHHNVTIECTVISNTQADGSTCVVEFYMGPSTSAAAAFPNQPGGGL